MKSGQIKTNELPALESFCNPEDEQLYEFMMLN